MNGPLARLNARTPLSVRLVVVLVALVTLGLVAAGAAAVAALRGYLVSQVDGSLRDLARQFSERVEPGMIAPPPGEQQDDRRGPPSDFYLRFSTADGSLVAVVSNPLSTSDGTPDLPAWTQEQVQAQGDTPFTVAAVDGGASWRVASAVTTSGMTVMVAKSLAPVEATVRQLVLVEVAVGVVVVVLMAVLAYALVRRSLRPLREVERTAGAIAAGDLSHRVPERDPRTEVGRLARAFNAMLAQIEQAFAVQAESEASARESERRMRRFVADASHELRTPLTSIRGFAELYRQGALRDRSGVDRAMSRIEGEATRMGLLVEDMLTLARRDQQRALAREPVDLLVVATDAVHDARAAAPDRAVALELGPAAGPPVVLGDEPSLRQVLANLVGNALVHTPAGTPITIRLATRAATSGEPAWAVLEVVDAGPGLTPEAAARVFERFYRADDARNRADGGSGLGLAIVDALVTAHDGRVELDTVPGNGATFRVLLPLADPA